MGPVPDVNSPLMHVLLTTFVSLSTKINFCMIQSVYHELHDQIIFTEEKYESWGLLETFEESKKE
jgi:hypothetical protein